MILINAKSIGDAHNKIVDLLSKQGKDTGTEDNEITKDLFEPSCIHIEDPSSGPIVSPYSLFGEGFMNVYKSALYTVTPRKNDGTDATYTYGNRICDYPSMKEKFQAHKRSNVSKVIDGVFAKLGYFPQSVSNALAYSGDGNGGGINQLQESVIKRIVQNPNTRRAEAITWVPGLDIKSSEPPCLQLLWFRVDDRGRLCVVAVFRSNDMLSAAGQNLVAIGAAQEYVLEEVNRQFAQLGKPILSRGWIELISLSPHMYFKRDSLELSRFTNKVTNKGLL